VTRGKHFKHWFGQIKKKPQRQERADGVGSGAEKRLGKVPTEEKRGRFFSLRPCGWRRFTRCREHKSMVQAAVRTKSK